MRPHELRSRVLTEWRGYVDKPLYKDTTRPIGEMLTKVMTGLGLKDRLREDEVLKAWADIVGPFIAQQSSPLRLKDGVLTVRVLQPTVHYELDRIWKPKLIEKMKEKFGPKTVKDIKFRIG